jgi:hypothetical protein
LTSNKNDESFSDETTSKDAYLEKENGNAFFEKKEFDVVEH